MTWEAFSWRSIVSVFLFSFWYQPSILLYRSAPFILHLCKFLLFFLCHLYLRILDFPCLVVLIIITTCITCIAFFLSIKFLFIFELSQPSFCPLFFFSTCVCLYQYTFTWTWLLSTQDSMYIHILRYLYYLHIMHIQLNNKIWNKKENSFLLLLVIHFNLLGNIA